MVGSVKNGSYLHMYFDGSNWQGWTDFGGNFSSNPSVVASSKHPDLLTVPQSDVQMLTMPLEVASIASTSSALAQTASSSTSTGMGLSINHQWTGRPYQAQ